MALRPQDVYQPIESDREEIARLEKKIDAHLKSQARYRGGSPITFQADSFGTDLVIKEALFKLYRKSGWTIEEHDDQRDGNYVSFTAPHRDSLPDAGYDDIRESHMGYDNMDYPGH